MNELALPDRYLRAAKTMPEPARFGSIKCVSTNGFHNLAYSDWGRRNSRGKILCVHGLTRNSRDFDGLASRLSTNARVVCPDLPGRGRSDWLAKASDYHLLQYNMDMTVLAAAVGFDRFDWIGTSLGGLMGMSLAGLNNSPIRRLIINDVGPTIPIRALQRICAYVGSADIYPTVEAIEAHLRKTLSPFGPMTDDDWARMAIHSSVANDNGFILRHDPGIIQNFRRYAMFMHFSLWRYWEKISCPVLILRGKESDFLTDSLLERMLSRLPHAEAVEFDGIGHTPTLNAPAQIDPIVEWLARTQPQVEN